MMGTMDEMINKLRLDEISPEEFIKFAKAERNKHQQTINPSQVGDVTEVVASVQDAFLSKNMPVNKSSDEDLDIIPMPPILCLDVDTKLRILKTDINTPTLNNNKMFMALTDKMVNSKRIFFTNPHTTRVIWSMHRLIYIFTDTLGANTLYYDLELTHKIPNSTGGHSIKSTTIITKDKIFVPIVEELYDYFDLKTDEKLKFLGRLHSSSQALEAIRLAKKYFDNIKLSYLNIEDNKSPLIYYPLFIFQYFSSIEKS